MFEQAVVVVVQGGDEKTKINLQILRTERAIV